MLRQSRNIFFVSVFSTIIIGTVLLFFIRNQESKTPSGKRQITDTVISVSFVVAGDAMAHYPQITSAYNTSKGDYDFYPVFQFIKPVINKFDFSIVNYETTAGGKPYAGYPQFSAPDTFAYVLKDAGFKFFVNANNHSVDRGLNGINKTIDIFDKYKIPHTGTFKDEESRNKSYPSIQYIKGLKIAILNYTYGTNGLFIPEPAIIDTIDTVQIKRDLKKALDSIPDVVIVCMHWGEEYKREPNQLQKDLAAFLFENGADIIVGSHPHVVQPLELMTFNYKNRIKTGLVIWSLGNFISNQRNQYTNGGILVNFTVNKNISRNSLTIAEVGYIPFWVYKAKSPEAFYILPVYKFENDTSVFKLSKTDKAAFTTFIKDTRSHLNRDTLNFKEFFPPGE
jgi:poly-gamma-glutamate capsule biosynthesis protein CapA/YwtB (metallophosphatase superfamily)